VLNSQFMPILQEVTQISAAMVADGAGREYMLMRTDQGWLTRLTDPQRWGRRARWTRWAGPGEVLESWQETLDYDPRTRPWFRGAVDSGSETSVFWTSPYRFFTSKEPGITAASRWPQTAQQGGFRVLAFDVRLSAISTLTLGLAPGEHGKAFVLSGEGRVIGVPGDAQFRSSASIAASVLTPAEVFPVAMVRDAYSAWLARGRPAGEPFVFETGDTAWWASFWDYALANRLFWLAVAVPEADLTTRLGGPGYAVPAAIVGIGIVVFLASLAAMRRSRHGRVDRDRPGNALDALLERSDQDPEQILALIRTGESERAEFKSAVRWNFKAARTGKEIELAWLKTVVAFLNSEGGVILLGVDDAGEILGLGRDGFANDDMALRHIENLIARHIGPGHFPYIRSRLVTVGDKKVLMILCQAAPKPVFLKHDKGEDFYIRTGPASRSLAPSEVLAYVETRRQVS
jgi:hypothetical protein